MKKNLIKLGKFFIGIMLIGIFSDFWGIFLGYFLGIDFGSSSWFLAIFFFFLRYFLGIDLL
ncbi:hypothetical protein [Candidatus Liberibacter solanacearum]|uniref:Uncharacterized protein n=1 Tax=Candidatus Liberibacter solanacearum TaxID=556287 RepID=A0A1V2N9L8_9HYPH|nr:hypothetical protein [Candidatus Liberibacter solanacearum]ONI58697.1 hypothetical protein AYJ09_04785 [Candidatus Liberibacter solanacearum]ONI60310.1 hypothetical protein AYO25_00385 [Candidatus Liberibacter solanacearum]